MRKRLGTHQIILASLAIMSCLLGVARGQAPQNFSAELSRAESLYRAAKFQESLILLTELEKRIDSSDPQRKNDVLKIKLWMGLAHAGMDQKDQAKSKFIEVCKLDSKYTLNPQDYPPPVVALYNEAKASCPPPPERSTTSTADLSITESTFLGGKELYEKGEYSDALKYFNVVLALDSSHVLAREYSDLAQQRLDLLADRGYTEWRASFDAKQFDKAAAAYNKIRSDPQLNTGKLSAQIESEYKKTLSGLVDSWKAACAERALTKLGPILNEATSVAAGLPFGRDALAQMQPCPSAPGNVQVAAGNPVKPPTPAPPPVRAPSPTPPPAKAPSTAPPPAKAPSAAPPPAKAPTPTPPPSKSPATNPAPPAKATPAPRGAEPARQIPPNCIKGDPTLAMARLKTRVNPQIDPSLQRYLVRGIVVSIHIDEEGNVEVNEVAKANPRIAGPIRAAVEQWKFNPTLINGQAKCVETDLPLAVIQP
ncbi:MAG TPA: hypothetical protein VE422_08085 [Terriglobia bacterium]|nr:hypothetical protein [Terriglobia bacterium]